MINKLLIANRGEIACRIIATAKKMGIETVAIFSDVDKSAQHVKLADASYSVGESTSKKSYLNQDKILQIARACEVDAIHPGYGFLSENADFATRCLKNDILFVGPSPQCLKQMADKAMAKQLMQQAGVPCTPSGKTPDELGYPLLIKAVAGGGGKGMRLVEHASDYQAFLIEAQQEALASFGDETVILEKYLKPARHIEVQIFADNAGNVVHLFDRDCSLQRRHQKIIEEAPAPNLSPKTREKMANAAINAAKSIQYSGAGTIEFLLTPDEQFYFMEMNTRLQVEHPVTEKITGIDLVEWQLRIASNEDLPLTQNEITFSGHAIEARICAESPSNNFTPATGTLDLLRFPSAARVDSGVIEGEEISPFYDPLIAKLIVYGDDREQALNQLQQALQATYIAGVTTNVSHLLKLSFDSKIIKAQLSTELVESTPFTVPKPSETVLKIASVILQSHQALRGKQLALQSAEPNSPWYHYDGWQPNSNKRPPFSFWQNKNFYEVPCVKGDLEWKNDFQLLVSIEKKTYSIATLVTQQSLDLFFEGQLYSFSQKAPSKKQKISSKQKNTYLSPMPASLVEICVSAGQKVNKGEKLMVLEAMKMQHTITAFYTGTVKNITHQVGDVLLEGDQLLEME